MVNEMWIDYEDSYLDKIIDGTDTDSLHNILNGDNTNNTNDRSASSRIINALTHRLIEHVENGDLTPEQAHNAHVDIIKTARANGYEFKVSTLEETNERINNPFQPMDLSNAVMTPG